MGLVLEEKTRRKLEDDKRAIFTLFAFTDDFHSNNDEGCYTCNVKIFNSNNQVVDEYYRRFLIDDFNYKHYRNFIKKFCMNRDYSKQFNVKNEIKEERQNGIDDELVDIIDKLNSLGLKTCYSCQGTKDPWYDRPMKSDGHGVLAYIKFIEKLPVNFLQLAKRCEYLDVSNNEICSRKRKFNIFFAECMCKIIQQWVAKLPGE
ncbi:MAG: hypothetical protein KAX49_13530 [Halanaerobiales bacterium]|nr:hypothetical protein [Halanaerobiales bacterium]